MQARTIAPAQHLQHVRSRLAAPRSRALLLVKAQAVDTSLYKLPIFFSSRAIFPAGTGHLTIFEPRYHKLLEDAKAAAIAAGGGRPKFGHLLDPEAAPPALMADAVGGVPRVGCVAAVKATHPQPDGSVVVEYEAVRRFKILSVATHTPYTEVFAMNYGDVDHGLGSFGEQQQQQLEHEVFRGLRHVAQLSTRLAESRVAAVVGGGEEEATAATGLPEALLRYAPPARRAKPLGQALSDAGYTAAGHSIGMWMAQGSVYGKAAARRKRNQDPYELAAGSLLGEAARRELFSFAAAELLDLDLATRLALLNSQDTTARLQWISAAVQPYVAELQARTALSTALKLDGKPLL
mmetsp:Transcript_7892/g.19725  ORF Transcript_7892/g.19725 Transcript_7892/m.19725 type:complete len:350 (-) Transcript_7892:1498-2547(-)|eukprot:CAMPEP_0202863040 /NCGR_PEP_ID=MMETSP1391-20130828/3843_1 /ASSEMBLY_ACC=CAM_ASM_000867 /TAXON_ID=1034604 /ORGANISM="Chlamydomonas leiostraca, Strain SAG 11-49" /LENGTH=349 /DNA_ID=CAMNT_0049542635 /DNA_START=88 /DNA_END=1137 /DNA_ORIENTATION=-